MKLWLDGSTIVIPTVIAIPGATRYSRRGFSLGPVNRGSWRTLLLRLALSRVGTDVLDEWVSSCQGALKEYPSSPYYNIRGPKANFFHVTFRKNFSGILCSRAKYGKSTAGHMPRRAPYDPL